MRPGWEAIHRFPALIFSLLIGIGIWVGSQLPHSSIVPLFALTTVATALAWVMFFPHRDELSAIVRSCCCILLCLSLGALKYRADSTPSLLLPSPGVRDTVIVVGEIADDPAELGGKTRFMLQVHAVSKGDSTLPCAEKGVVTCIGMRGDSLRGGIRYGTVLALRGVVENLPESGNPGEFNPRQYYNANGITFTMRVRGGRGVQILDSSAGSAFMKHIVFPLRGSVLASIDRDIGGEEGEFLKGLLIGARSGLSPAVRRAFLDSGVAHILAVSGSNVAVVAATILMVLSLLRVPRTVARILTMCGLVVYMFVSGAQPPVVRATVMAIALLISGWLTRRVHPLNGVGLAALAMFAIDARQLFDVGFQLSFGAVLSILLLYPRLLLLVRHQGPATGVWRLVSPIASLVALSVAASIGTLPLTAIAFGRLSIVGFLANLVIVPASGASVVLGMVSAAVAPLNEWVAGTYAAVNRILLMLTISGAEFAASVPWATLDTVGFRPVHSLPYYAGLAFLFCIGQPAPARRLAIVFLATINLALFFPTDSLVGPASAECRITMIDVGQGDAFLLQSPAGHNYLVDTGPPSRDGSAWGTSVVPLLKRLSVQSLDAVIITHVHDDHVGSLGHVVRSFDVRRVIVTPDAAPLASALMGRDTGAIDSVFRGRMFGDPACRFYVLGPESTSTGSGDQANRRSIVLKMQYANFSVILMGDAEQDEEFALVNRYGEFLRSDVLKIGHHGSRAGTSAAFLAAVEPEYALISVGRYNRFGHPSGATLERLDAAGVEVLRSDEIGAAFLATDGTSVRQLHWR